MSACESSADSLHSLGVPPPCAAEDEEEVCYEGCFTAATDQADPLPVFLLSSSSPMSLVDCYTAAVQANLTYFAIIEAFHCFGGGDLMVEGDGWLPAEDCLLDCAPGAATPGACGSATEATFFSMGACRKWRSGEPLRQCLPGQAGDTLQHG
jgi:hypothetical protein